MPTCGHRPPLRLALCGCRSRPRKPLGTRCRFRAAPASRCASSTPAAPSRCRSSSPRLLPPSRRRPRPRRPSNAPSPPPRSSSRSPTCAERAASAPPPCAPRWPTSCAKVASSGCPRATGFPFPLPAPPDTPREPETGNRPSPPSSCPAESTPQPSPRLPHPAERPRCGPAGSAMGTARSQSPHRGRASSTSPAGGHAALPKRRLNPRIGEGASSAGRLHATGAGHVNARTGTDIDDSRAGATRPEPGMSMPGRAGRSMTAGPGSTRPEPGMSMPGRARPSTMGRADSRGGPMPMRQARPPRQSGH